MRPVKIYLAHPSFLREKGFQMERMLRSDGFFVINPLRIGEKHMTLEETLHKDLDLINQADILVAYLPEKSGGVMFELFYAFAWGKKVYIVTKLRNRSFLKFVGEIDSTFKNLRAKLKNERVKTKHKEGWD